MTGLAPSEQLALEVWRRKRHRQKVALSVE
jgi:hypothetical protein